MARFPTLRYKGVAAALGVAVGVAAMLGARDVDIDPSQSDRLTAKIVAELIERAHLAKPEIDDELAREWHQLFFKMLDPKKLYFTGADIEEFAPFAEKLDDQVRLGDLSFAEQVFGRYLERRSQRLATINELLDDGFDFDVDETYIDEPDELDYPADDAEARDRWRKELKYQLLSIQLGGDDYDEAVRRLRVRYRDLDRIYRQMVENENGEILDLLEIYLSSLAMAIDPHSSYLHWKNLEDMMKQDLQLSLEGIGASLAMEDGVPTIKAIVPGGAADKDGRLKAEDKILGVEGEDGEAQDFVEKKLSDVVRVIRGPRGTQVRLIVQPAGTKERKVFEITREKIELADAHAKGQVIETTDEGGEPVTVGVIDLPSFYGDTAAVRRGDEGATSATGDVRRLLDEFEERGVDCVLIDLRRNGGGLLLEAISLSGLFIDTGPVVRVRNASGIMPYDDEDAGTAYDGPLAVLISRGSASASEIFAGVIKDYGRGLIVGDSSTYGKGTVQSIINLDDWIRGIEGFPSLGALKLTIQQFYRANGMSTQVRGVRPDVHIPSLNDHFEQLGEGSRDHALAFDQIKPVPHDHYGRVPTELVAKLDARSLDRRKRSDDFRKLDEAIAKLIERENTHAVPLNAEAFREEFGDEDDAADELIEQPEALPNPADSKDVWNEDSFYNQEVLKIVADYITLGSDIVVAAPVREGAAPVRN